MAKRTKADDLTGDLQNDASENGSDGGIVDSVKQAASQSKETAGNVIDQAKGQAAAQVDQQRQTVASGIQAVAQAFRSMGGQLRDQQQGPVAEYAAKLGDGLGGQVEQLANYLRGRDLHQLLADAEDFGRRSPAVFIGSAFLVGLATSRFLKSSRTGSGAASTSGSSQQNAVSTPAPLPAIPVPPAGNTGLEPRFGAAANDQPAAGADPMVRAAGVGGS